MFQFISAGTIDSRYFILPFISAYSLIIFVWYYILKKHRQIIDLKEYSLSKKVIYNILTFLCLSLGVFLVELIFGHLIEFLTGLKLWDYSESKLHITKFTSIFSTFGFGFGSLVLIKLIYPMLLEFLENKTNIKIIKLIDIILGVLIALDTLIFWINLIFFHKAIIYWKIYL